MKKFNEFTNESIRDKMTAKSNEDIMKSLDGKSPFGIRSYFSFISEEGPMDIPQIIKDKIKEAEKELDDIFENYSYDYYEYTDLNKLLDDVSNWVFKYGGNGMNLLDYGLKDFASHLKEYGYSTRHDSPVIYNKETIMSFVTLLKNMALNEVNNNNNDPHIDAY